MATRIPATSSVNFHAVVAENLEDPVFGELMTKAVTVVPCGHIFNEETVIQCLARDRLCPLDRQPIERHVPNYTIRHLAATAGAQPVEEAPTAEAIAHFTEAKRLSEQGDYEGGIVKLLAALQLSPTYEKAQAYLDFCLQQSSKTSPGRPSSVSSTLSSSPSSPPALVSSLETAAEKRYIDLLFQLLDEADVQRHPALQRLLEQQIEQLMEQETVLTASQKKNYEWTEKLLGEDRKVRQFVMKKLQEIHASSATGSSISQSSAVAATTNPSLNALTTPSLSSMPTSAVTPTPAYPSVPMPTPPLAGNIAPAARKPTPPPVAPTLPAIAFGAPAWKEYLGDVGVEPPLPPDIQQILDAPCPIWSGKKVRETHLLTLIPQTVNGQPLTFKTLRELVQKPRKGTPTKYHSFSLGDYTDPPAPASHWALFSRDVIPGSREKSYAEQQQLVQQYPGYVMPTILDATVSIFMAYLKTGTRLYGNQPWTFTRCQEKHAEDRQLIVGGFAPDGLTVSSDDYLVSEDSFGVGALRKL